MSDTWNVAVVVIPPPGTGPVLLAGAASVVASAMVDLELDFDHYVEEAGSEGVEITLVGLAADGRSENGLHALITVTVRDLVGSTPELAAWGYRVHITAESDEEPEDLDAKASRLVPDGEQLADDLLHAIAYQGSVYDAARRLTAWKVDDLTTEDLDSLSREQRGAAVRRSTALAGCLMHAAEIVIDHLFDDIDDLRAARGGDPFDIRESWVLSGLLARFADRYTPLFAQRFLVALVDVTARFTGAWTPLACVTQELGLRVVLDHVELVAETADVRLDVGWRAHTSKTRSSRTPITRCSTTSPSTVSRTTLPCSLREWHPCASRTGSHPSTTTVARPRTPCRTIPTPASILDLPYVDPCRYARAMAARDEVTTFEQLQGLTAQERQDHFRASIVSDLDHLTPRERELLQEQNRRVLAREARPRGKAGS
jgi:hypothetical protein